MRNMSNLQNEDEQLDELLQEIDELSDCYEAEFEERPFIEFIDSAEDDQNKDGFALVFAFLFARRYGSKFIGGMIIAGGAIMLVGMMYAYSLLDYIEPIYLVEAVQITPIIFMVVSIPVMIVGGILLKEKKRRPKKEYV